MDVATAITVAGTIGKILEAANKTLPELKKLAGFFSKAKAEDRVRKMFDEMRQLGEISRCLQAYRTRLTTFERVDGLYAQVDKTKEHLSLLLTHPERADQTVGLALQSLSSALGELCKASSLRSAPALRDVGAFSSRGSWQVGQLLTETRRSINEAEHLVRTIMDGERDPAAVRATARAALARLDDAAAETADLRAKLLSGLIEALSTEIDALDELRRPETGG